MSLPHFPRQSRPVPVPPKQTARSCTASPKLTPCPSLPLPPPPPSALRGMAPPGLLALLPRCCSALLVAVVPPSQDPHQPRPSSRNFCGPEPGSCRQTCTAQQCLHFHPAGRGALPSAARPSLSPAEHTSPRASPATVSSCSPVGSKVPGESRSRSSSRRGSGT